jgi:hypothetical protein
MGKEALCMAQVFAAAKLRIPQAMEGAHQNYKQIYKELTDTEVQDHMLAQATTFIEQMASTASQERTRSTPH